MDNLTKLAETVTRSPKKPISEPAAKRSQFKSNKQQEIHAEAAKLGADKFRFASMGTINNSEVQDNLESFLRK